MKKIKNQQDAVDALIKWRSHKPTLNEDPIMEVSVVQKSWPGAKPNKCWDNTINADKKFKVVAGWMISEKPVKLDKKGTLRGYTLTPHFWNAYMFIPGIMHGYIDGTPFVTKGGPNIGGLVKNYAYVMDMDLYDFPRELIKCGIENPQILPDAFMVLENGEFYRVDTSHTKYTGDHVELDREYLEGNVDVLFYDTVYPGDQLHPTLKAFKEAA